MSETLALRAAPGLAEAEAQLARMRAALPKTNEPLRKAARRLRWFRAAFHSHIALIERETGRRFAIDKTALAAVFVDWLRALAAQRPDERGNREAFTAFAGGLALREFCRHHPLRLISPSEGPQAADPEGFWPEGHAATSFCLALTGAVLEQDHGHRPMLDPLYLELRSWWSFRENARKDPSFATGFLQAISGQEPNWQLPDIFRAREPGPHAF